MNPYTNQLVNSNSQLFNLDSLSILNNKVESTNELKLQFNEKSLLHLYVEITGFTNKSYIGKTFTIEKSQDEKDHFFQKLFNLIKEKGNIPLIKNTYINGNIFWTKANFEINSSENKITFTVKEELTFQKENRLNKLIKILNSLEAKLNTTVCEKYLNGYLEERGATTFKEYINS